MLLVIGVNASAQLKGVEVVKVPECRQPYVGEYIHIPDVDGYKSLKCDFHVHTIFSDGEVIPENRMNTILGSATVEFKVRLDDKLRFANTYITDDSQLVVDVASLR